MANWVRYVSHPEVVVDPAVAVPRWHLSAEGVAVMRGFARSLPRPGAVWASSECDAPGQGWTWLWDGTCKRVLERWRAL